MNIELKLAAIGEKSILRHLLELAQYDYSEYDGYDLDEHGLYGYRFLDHYWTDSDRYPFIIRVDGKLAGLALVRVYDRLEDQTIIYSIGEFCVLKKYRGQGVGKEVTKRIFSRFKGKWILQTCRNNETARKFWRHVTAEFPRTEFAPKPEDETMVVMEFEVK